MSAAAMATLKVFLGDPSVSGCSLTERAQLPVQDDRMRSHGRAIWLWVKNGYPKYNPGKWSQGLNSAAPLVV